MQQRSGSIPTKVAFLFSADNTGSQWWGAVLTHSPPATYNRVHMNQSRPTQPPDID